MADQADHWVFGLSMEEDISWAAARVGPDNEFVGKPPEQHGVLLSIGEANSKIRLERRLRTLLQVLKDHPETGRIFLRTKAIGVSTTGLVDRKNLRLTSIARKDWMGEEDETGEQDCVVDFDRLFDGDLFPDLIEIHQTRPDRHDRAINVHNDATARCLLEYYRQPSDDKAETLFHVLMSEGVNGGLVVRGWPFSTELHPEIGHIWPKLHPKDRCFHPRYSGCPIHKECFEGVASGARIRKSWGRKPFSELGPDYPDDSDHPWQRIAFYIAQLCMNATLAVSPERIMVGGPVIFPKLIPIVKEWFGFFNSGNTRNPDGSLRNYLKYDAMLRDDFIQIARVRQGEGILGALELGRLALHPTGRAFVLSARHARLAPVQRLKPTSSSRL